MKKIILISLGVIILVFGGIFVYISQMDWNAHKERLAAQLSSLIGKKIEFSGNLTVKVFPHTQLSAVDVQVINPQTEEKLATIRLLESEVSLSSLLKGKPDVESLSMEGVETWFKFNEKGVSNWHQNGKSDVDGGEGGFNLRNFDIQKSVIHYSNAQYDLAVDLTNFNAEVQLSSINGPYRLDGNFVKDGDRYGVALGLGGLSQFEDVGISVVVTHPKTDSYLRYDGSYNASASELHGDVSGNSKKTADFVNSIVNDKLIREEFNEALMFSASLQSEASETKLSRLVIKFDKLFEGSGDVIIPMATGDGKPLVDVKYQLVSLNFRPLQKIILEQLNEYKKGEKYNPKVDFDVAYDITSERVVVSDEPTGVLENVSAKGIWKDNAFNLDDFYAACPGNIVFSMRASLLEKESVPFYFANATFNGQNFLSLINALGMKVKSPKQSSYRDVNLGFELHGNPQTLNVENFNLKMDKAEVEANAVVHLDSNEYEIGVNVDVLNLDNYVIPPVVGEDEEPASLADVIIAESKRMSWLKDNAVEVVLKAKSAVYKGVSARNVELDFISDGAGIIAVKRAALNSVLGANVEAAGVVQNFGEDSLNFDDVTFDLRADNVKMLADRLGIGLPKWPLFEQKNFVMSGALNGYLRNVYAVAQLLVGQHQFKYDGELSAREHLNFEGDVLVKTSRMEGLLNMLVGNVSGNVYRGPLVAKAFVKGNSKNWVMEDADIQMGIDKYTANLNISESKKSYAINGTVNTNELNLMNWINIQKTRALPKMTSSEADTFIAKPNFSGDVINYNSYRDLNLDINLAAERSTYKDYVMNNLKVHIINEQNMLQFQDLSFDNAKHNVSGLLQIAYGQTPQMKGKLDVSYPIISGLGGSLYDLGAKDVKVVADFETSAATVADMVDALSGKLSVSGSELDFKGINLQAIGDDLRSREYSKGLYQVVRDNMQSGETVFGPFSVEVQLNNGVATLSPNVLKNDAVYVDVSGSVNLKEWKINDKFRVRYPELKNVPSYYFTLSGMLNKPTVDISVEDVAKKYDEHWKRIEEQERERQEAIRQEQTERLNVLQNQIAEYGESSTTVMKQLEDLMVKCLTELADAQYQEKLDLLNDVNSRVDNIEAKIAGNVSDEEITQYTNDMVDFQRQMAELPIVLEGYYHDDIENQRNSLSGQENDLYNQVVQLFNEFESMWAENRRLLEQYDSIKFLEDNAELNGFNNNFHESKNIADTLHTDFGGRNQRFAETGDWVERYDVVVGMEDLWQQESNVYPQMQEVMQKAKDMLEQLVEKRRVVFETERQKQAEIDAQNLLLSSNSNPKTVVEDEFVPVAEEKDTKGSEAISKDDVKADEISGYDAVVPNELAVRGKIVTQYDKKVSEEKAQPKSSGLLTKVEGEVQKASGKISVK